MGGLSGPPLLSTLTPPFREGALGACGDSSFLQGGGSVGFAHGGGDASPIIGVRGLRLDHLI